ncbi:MAM and LDL-receptor class A domain-containing protein 1-like isoform X2 [Mercenaria mercenaria]|uniref:MAM and LDL-receptor class A domain-containing protein 1-like isoform X2 n=1 Tax=Mercenaria mercenaria TaxID=6596 RepID=UPI00234EC3BA|nr:MAM and LDL-receptor class A domain-containing protein 1-like isoform X2 [Mercenaria mercenaria]
MDGFLKYCMLCYLFHITKALWSAECTFEDGFCDWENVTSDWIPTQSGITIEKIQLPPHRTKNDDVYIAINNTRIKQAVNAKLISPRYPQGHACFGLWYSLHKGKSKITIRTIENQKEKETDLKKSEPSKWKHILINVSPSERFNIEIVGELKNSNAGFVAVDDTMVTTGTLCSADCNFDVGFCAWEQQGNAWKRINGSTLSDDKRPTKDHTSGDGYYIYVKGEGRLSVMFEGAGQNCLTFWFYIYDENRNSLHVYVTTYADGKQPVYSVDKNKTKQWIEAQIDIVPEAHTIILEGETNTGNSEGIAVDDILIRAGVCNPGETGRSLVAVYVSVPLIITLTVVISVSIFIWRYANGRTSSDARREALGDSKGHLNSSVTNKSYTGHIPEKQNNQMHTKASETTSVGSDYAVITDGNIQPHDCNKTEYNTININQKIQHDRDYGYDRLQHTLSPFVDKSYSHVLPNDNNSFDRNDGTVKPLAASRNETQRGCIDPAVSNAKENTCIGSIPCDTTQSTPKFAFEMEDELDVEYDHAQAGGLDPDVAKRDDYSHLHSADSNIGAIKDKRANRTEKTAGNPKENAEEDNCFSILEKDGNFEDVPGTQDSSCHDYFVLEKEQ